VVGGAAAFVPVLSGVVVGVAMLFLSSAASSSSAVFWKATSMAFESLSLNGMYFFGFGSLVSGARPWAESGFLFGAWEDVSHMGGKLWIPGDMNRIVHSTYVYGIVPLHGHGRAVLGIPLGAQPVPPVHYMVSALLWCRPACFLLLPLHAVLVSRCLGRFRSCWRFRRGSTGAPGREVGEEAGLVVRGRHPVDGRSFNTATESAQPGLCVVP
jgi:hypothetical protein